MLTEEEKKQKKREWYWKNREKILEKAKENAKKRYEENKIVILERNKKWKSENPEYMTIYREEHKEEISEYNKKYSKTPIGRAWNLYGSYVVNDRKHERIGEELPTNYVTPKWIVENIFSGQKCHYCEESDWTKLGCDRIDNDKPHTIDNVVPCCLSCNSKKGSMSYVEFMKMLGKTP